MSARRRRAGGFRLVVILVLLGAAIWGLYRHFLQLPPAPPPPVRLGAEIVANPAHV